MKVAIVLVALVVAAAALDIAVEGDRPLKARKPAKGAKLVPVTVYQGHWMPKKSIIIVPKGDPRARGMHRPIPRPARHVRPGVGPARHVRPVVGPVRHVRPVVAARKPSPPSAAAFRRVVLRSTAPGAGCTKIGGTCTSGCTTGRTQSGLCPGSASVKCCLPAVTKPSTPSTPSTPSAPTSTGSCGAYANLTPFAKTGNKGVSYQVVFIQKSDLSTPSSYGVPDTQADNTIVKTTACKFAAMKAAASAAGVDLTISSGFRTLARQQYFYNCYKTKKCNQGNLAAVPGSSNHGTGIAVDLNTNCGGQTSGAKTPSACKSSKVYMWLYNNAQKFGFIRAVNKEPWHWELHPGASPPWFQSF